MLSDFEVEANLVCLNTRFEKDRNKQWTHIYPNGVKAQLDYIFINKKWINSAMNCQPYNSFRSVYSDHRIVTSDIRLSLCANKKSEKVDPYDWSSIRKPSVIRDAFTLEVKNRYQALKQSDVTANPSQLYTHFENAVSQAAKETIPLKPKQNKRVPWESAKVQEQREILKQAAKIKNKRPNRSSISKYKAAEKKLNPKSMKSKPPLTISNQPQHGK